MSAQFIAAKAQKTGGSPSAPSPIEPMPISAEEKAHFDTVFGGDNQSEEMTAESLQAASALISGEIIPESVVPPVKEGGVVAATTPEVVKEVPETPETPANPETPETPETVETPETPEVPETPANPEVAVETPETPEVETEETKANRMRVRKTNMASEVEWKATQLMNAGMPLEEAVATANKLVKKGESAATTPAIVLENLPETQDLRSAETLYNEKKAAYVKASQEFLPNAAELQIEMLEAKDKVDQAKVSVTKAAELENTLTENLQQALTEYPESGVEGSPMFKEVMYQVTKLTPAELKRSDRNTLIAERAAKAIGIKPVSQRTPSTSVATTPSITPAKGAAKPTKVTPVSGAARTVTPTIAPETALKTELAKILGKDADMVDALEG